MLLEEKRINFVCQCVCHMSGSQCQPRLRMSNSRTPDAKDVKDV